MAELSHKIIRRLDTVHVVLGDDPNYPASCSVFQYGDRGFMYSINGREFYRYFGQAGKVAELMAGLGVRSLEGYVTAAHERAMRAGLRRSATVERAGEGTMDGKPMVWVVVRAK